MFRLLCLLIIAVNDVCSDVDSSGTTKLHSDTQRITIGGWISSPKEAMLAKWSPLFETYLTEEVGSLYDPPIKFQLVPLDYDASSDRQLLMDTGQLDFAYQTGGSITCLEAEFQFSTVATVISVVGGQHTYCYGSVIYSLKSNKVSSLSEFRDKRLGVGFPGAPGGFQLGSKYLNDMGLNIYTSFSQIVFYMNDYEGLMNDVLKGIVDVGITQSGWMEANFPEMVPKLQYHDLKNITFHSIPYRVPTSTNVVPNAGLAAAPHVTSLLRWQVSQALTRLTADHPAARAAGIAGFILPESYEVARSLVEGLGILQETPAGKRCIRITDSLDTLPVCPPGFALERGDSLSHACAKRHLPCPAGRSCFCQPCHRDIYVNIFPWQIVMGLCCALFAVGLCFSIGWTTLLQAEQLAEDLGVVKKHGRGGGGGQQDCPRRAGRGFGAGRDMKERF